VLSALGSSGGPLDIGRLESYSTKTLLWRTVTMRSAARQLPLMTAIAFFDMDRTLVCGDTATLYTRHRFANGRGSRGELARVAWWMLQYGLGVLDAPKVAQRVMRTFAGTEETRMVEDCRACYQQRVASVVASSGRRQVQLHRERGELTVVVTSASRYIALPLLEDLGADALLCTELEVSPSGRFTGRLQGKMCFGAEKVSRAAAFATQHGATLGESWFYSDSITDRPLLEAVGKPVVVNPDVRLRRLARLRGWPIERWT
jgi:HAD superfamily hydrolase (TIGR01490 family)